MARRGKRSFTKIIAVLGVLALAVFGVYTLVHTPTGQTTIKAAEAGHKAAAKVIKADKKYNKR